MNVFVATQTRVRGDTHKRLKSIVVVTEKFARLRLFGESFMVQSSEGWSCRPHSVLCCCCSSLASLLIWLYGNFSECVLCACAFSGCLDCVCLCLPACVCVCIIIIVVSYWMFVLYTRDLNSATVQTYRKRKFKWQSDILHNFLTSGRIFASPHPFVLVLVDMQIT